MVSDYIYIVHCEQHIHTNIYKIGRTSQQEFRRFNGYPKNSELLLYMHVDDSHTIELELLSLFKEKYTQITSAGAEYFQGDVKEMVKDVVSICLMNFGPTVTQPITDELMSIFPNYKYDYSFGGRHRLCLLRDNILFYIDEKKLMSCNVDKTFAENIFKYFKNDKSKLCIKNNVYFKYTEEIISQVVKLLPYTFKDIISNKQYNLLSYSSFINHPQNLFTCNCKIGIYYQSFNNNKLNNINDTFIVKQSYIISQTLMEQLIPYKILFNDEMYGVIYDDQDISHVDCDDLCLHSKCIDNDVILYSCLYNNLLKDKICLVDEYTDIVNKYLPTVSQLFNDVINVDTIDQLYNPFKDAINADDVLQSYNNYINVMSYITTDAKYNYGLYWLLTKDDISMFKGKDLIGWLFHQYTGWIINNEINYHDACKWWFNNTKYWIINNSDGKVNITWNDIVFNIN